MFENNGHIHIIAGQGQKTIWDKQACGNTMPDLRDQVLDKTGQVLFYDLLVHGQVK